MEWILDSKLGPDATDSKYFKDVHVLLGSFDMNCIVLQLSVAVHAFIKFNINIPRDLNLNLLF